MVAGETDPSLSQQLARYWSGATAGDLPADAVQAAKNFILDTIACAVAGARTEAVDAIALAIRDLGADGGACSLWGREGSASADRAALLNATAAHALELDDFGGCGHSGAVVIPSVLAAAEQRGASGAEVLLAVVAGYDVAARVLEGAGGYRRHNDLGWHSTGTCGSFGAAAGVARLMGLDAARFTSALGIAGTFTGGIWAFLADGAMTKRFHPGKAAETGTAAAYLARAGMSGPAQVLDAAWGGFLGTYAPGIAEPALVVRDLGSAFRILRSGIKPYACCRTIHAPIDSLLELMQALAVDASEIERIVVHGNQQTSVQFDRPRLGSLLDAQFSMQFCLAAAAVTGRLDLPTVEAWTAPSPEIERLMERVSIVPDRVLAPTDYPGVELVTRDGRRDERQVQFAKGHADNPLTSAEVEAKARSLLAPALGEEITDELVDMIARLETLDDIRRLTALLEAPPRQHG